MKKTISRIKVGIGIAIVVIGIVIFVLVSNCIHDFFSGDGFQVLGKFAHIDYQEKCYFIDKERKVVGDSTFTISGILYDRHKSMFNKEYSASGFRGHMEVDAYPIPLSKVSHVGEIVDNGLAFTSYRDNKLEHYYIVHVLRSNPDIVVVHIELENGEYLTAVCGESEDEALENYQHYLEKFFE